MNMWDRFINWLEFKPKPLYSEEIEEFLVEAFKPLKGFTPLVQEDSWPDAVFDYDLSYQPSPYWWISHDPEGGDGTVVKLYYGDTLRSYLYSTGAYAFINEISGNGVAAIKTIDAKAPTKRSKPISSKKATSPKGKPQDKRSEAVVKRKKDVKPKPSKKRTKKYV